MTHREIDVLIAEKVLGCKLYYFYDGILCGCNPWVHAVADNDGCRLIKPYSTSIEAAWEVVSKLEDEFEIRIFGPHPRLSDEDWDQWECEFTNKTTRAWYSGVGETTCEAICLAALKTVGIRTLIDF